MAKGLHSAGEILFQDQENYINTFLRPKNLNETQGEDVDPLDYGHGSSLTDLLRPREEKQAAQAGEALATTKCQVNPQEPAYRPPCLQDTTYYPTTSLHPQQHTPPQHCLGLDIVASHLTSSHLGGQQQQQQQQQVYLSSGAGGHLTRPRQQANLFSSLSSSSSSASPPTAAQHYPDFQFAPEPLSPPDSHHQYTLPCNRRLSQPGSVHLEKAWNHLQPPERFNHTSKKASAPFFENTKGVQSQAQPRKAPLPPSQLHLSQL